MRQVTGALQKVATARMANIRRHMDNADRYVDRLHDLLDDVYRSADHVSHPLCHPPTGHRCRLVVFSSDRGLCGAFNSRMMTTLTDFANHYGPENVSLVVVGKILARRSKHHGLRVLRTLPQPSFRGGAVEAALRELLQDCQEAFEHGDVDEVRILSTRFVTVLEQIPQVERLLPVPLGQDAATNVAPTDDVGVTAFEPDPALILSRLLEEYLYHNLLDAYLNSLSSENACRQASMSRATDNASDLLAEQMQSYRRRRQENITEEMIELARP